MSPGGLSYRLDLNLDAVLIQPGELRQEISTAPFAQPVAALSLSGPVAHRTDQCFAGDDQPPTIEAARPGLAITSLLTLPLDSVEFGSDCEVSYYPLRVGRWANVLENSRVLSRADGA